MRVSLVVLSMVGCAQVASAEPARPSALRRCPTAEEAATLWPALLAPGPDEAVDLYACTPGHFGRDGWALEVYVTREPKHSYELDTLVLDASTGAAIVHEREDDIATHSFDMKDGVKLTAADLDGDGVDEIIREGESDSWGDQVRELLILAVRAGHLVPLGRVALDHRNAAADPHSMVNCTATWSLRRRGGRAEIAVRGRVTEIPRGGDDQCPAPGRHSYRVRGGKVARIR